MADTPVWDGTPTCEVRIYRDGVLVHSELCGSDADVVAVARRWDDDAFVTIEVDSLTVRHRAGDSLEPEPPAFSDADHSGPP